MDIYSQSPTQDIQAGTILANSYQIQEEIGRGGFSIVYRATEVGEPDRQVAIKRIPLSTLTPSQVIDATETFNRELAMLTRFSGTPGVPNFYGHLTDQENWYLVMQYIKGETLEEALQKAPGGYFDEKKTIRIGSQLAQIFNELHTNQPPVIFRDVKPANIMLTPENELFLIDFGIARHFTWGKARDTTPLGSPGYAAPEQYGRAQTNRRADIYGLGATLQTLVTGRDPLELASGETSRNPQPPSPALRTLLDQMLAPDLTQRPIDMREVQTRLDNIVPPQTEANPLPFRTSTRGLILLSSVAVALLIWIAQTSFWISLAFMVNLCLNIVLYLKGVSKLPYAAQFIIFALREIVKYTWFALFFLWIILAVLHGLLRLP